MFLKEQVEPHFARQLRGRFFPARSNLFCRVGAGAFCQLGNVAAASDLSHSDVQSPLSECCELWSLLADLVGKYEDGGGWIGGVICVTTLGASLLSASGLTCTS